VFQRCGVAAILAPYKNLLTQLVRSQTGHTSSFTITTCEHLQRIGLLAGTRLRAPAWLAVSLSVRQDIGVMLV